MKFISLYIFLPLLAILTSCANQSSPTGGPKDEDPPQLVSSKPENQQLNFTAQEIELEFDELITVNNINKQLIITPRTDIEYSVKFKKNKVVLSFDTPLDSNTTYTFNFRESIKDLNEGNIPPEFQLAFSTGNYLDSMKISGNVSRLFTGEPVNEISVALYAAYDTMDVFNDPPLYLTKTNKVGKYEFKNLKIGTYKIIAFDDKNDNLTLQTSNEAYGFSEQLIELDTTFSDYNLSIFNLNVDSLKLQSARPSGRYFVIKYNKSLIDYSVTFLGSEKTIYSSLIGENKEIKIYNNFDPFDSLAIISTVKDSIHQTLSDTVYLKFEETKRDKDPYNYKVVAAALDFENPELAIEITFDKPSYYKNSDSLFLFIDSLTQINLDTPDFTWNTTHSTLLLNKKIQKEQFIPKPTGDTTATGEDETTLIQPHLYLGLGAFYSIESDTSISSSTKLKQLTKNEDTGIIKVQATNTQVPFVLQLLDKKHKVVAEIHSIENNSPIFVFNNIKPGDYQLRSLIDNDSNGKWELGNILKNIPPERIIFYLSEEGNKDITLRANWELGPLNFEF